MQIYFINLDGNKHCQYKTYSEAHLEAKKLIEQFSNSKIEIKVEEYCEYGHCDNCCKIYELFVYDNGVYK